MLRFVPDAHLEGSTPTKLRAAWEGAQKEEMVRITAALRALPTAQFEEIGDRATMAYGSGGTVQLLANTAPGRSKTSTRFFTRAGC